MCQDVTVSGCDRCQDVIGVRMGQVSGCDRCQDVTCVNM